ncbi:MAG TPA: sensor domain-containing diguanylate cyclase [Frankiaceae bacterium]|nr:sensor domain-containing diguanylate cyclase [Frankiaceae bacterium]
MNAQGAAHLEDVLDALLRRPDALIVPCDDDGFRVPVPESLCLPASRTVPLGADRVTGLDLMVPEDILATVAAWESAQVTGLAQATVHLRTDPKRALTLSIVDGRPRHGAWITAFSDPSLDDVVLTGPGPVVSGSRAVPLRPRTATIHKSILAMITAVDDRATRMLGWTPAQMVGLRSSEFIHPDDRERSVANWLELLAKQDTVRVRLRHRCADGSWLWVEVENVYQAAEDGAEAAVVAQVSDISDEMAVHEELDRRERLLHRLAESIPIGIVQLAPDRSVVYVNSRLARLLGVVGGAAVEDLLAPVVPADRPRLDAALAAALENDTDTDLEVQVRHALGATRICAVNVISLSDDEGAPGALLCLSDITDSARMREELTFRATVDALTGAHNRASILATLEAVLAVDASSVTAVVFVDLDQFKSVNDTYGHAAGDALLVQTANRLAGVLRRDDAVGRIGGDEFLLVSRGLESVDAALGLADRVREALQQPVDLGMVTVGLPASIGVACSAPGLDGATLIKQADLAMYESKQRGDGRPVLFEWCPGDRARSA